MTKTATSTTTTTTTTTSSTSTSTSTSTTVGSLQQVVNAQLDSLDDTDPYATAWTAALRSATAVTGNTNQNKKKIAWGGRGQGGRGRARRTFQPVDVVVDNISLVYPGSDNNKHQRTLLDDASLKLLAGGHVYALVGANGCGKSSLLRRIHSGSIPGFPPHISTLYLAQEVVITMNDNVDDTTTTTTTNQTAAAAAAAFSVLDELLARHRDFYDHSTKAAICAVQDLERQMEEEDLDLSNTQDQERMQEIMEQIAALEQDVEEENDSKDVLRRRAQEAISFLMDNVGNADKNNNAHEKEEEEEAEVDIIDWSTIPMSSLSMGLRKKAILATALLCPCDLLLLDEPAKFLDVSGLLQLRRLLSLQGKRSTAAAVAGGEQQQPQTATTILLVSHDIDLINEVATDVIEMRNHKLYEYAGCNFDAYQRCKSQENRHLLSKAIVLDKKQAALQQTLQHLKAQPVSKRGAVSKKKGRRIGAHHTKMERVEREQQSLVDELQAANLLHPSCGSGNSGTSGSSGGIGKATTIAASVNKSARGGSGGVSSSSSLPTEKAIQFVFRDPSSQWGEPLIIAFDVGHGYNLPPRTKQELGHHHTPVNDAGVIVKKKGYLFDFVDLCIEEGETYCILGSNAGGKSTLLQILGKLIDPVEGRVKHALNIKVGYLGQELVDDMIQTGLDDGAQNAIIFLLQRFPKKTEQDIRNELINFGISPLQATTDLCFLSGGERSRVCLAAVMLQDPHVLLLDNPTSNLDPESVQALIHGLKQWKGTLVLVSHDAHLVRSLEAQCHVLMSSEGKLRRVQGGVDDYLRSFAMSNRTSSR